MRSAQFCMICLLFFLTTASLSGQTDFRADPERATVYFIRTSAVGAVLNYKYFADDQYLGKINYGKFLKVTFEPGEYVLWAKAENIDYLEAKLEAGQTYVVNARPIMGMVKSGLRLMPVHTAQGRKADKAVRALLKHEEIKYTPAARDEEGQAWNALISRSMQRYEQIKANSLLDEPTRLDTPMDLSALVARIR